MTTPFSGTVPQDSQATDIRDRLYRSLGQSNPIEVVLTQNLANGQWAGTTGYYAGNQPSQNANDSISLNVLGRYYHVIQVASAQATAFQVKIQGSIDGLTWYDISGTTQTVAGIYSFTGIYKYLRVQVVSLTLAGGYDNTQDYGVRVVYIGMPA